MTDTLAALTRLRDTLAHDRDQADIKTQTSKMGQRDFFSGKYSGLADAVRRIEMEIDRLEIAEYKRAGLL